MVVYFLSGLGADKRAFDRINLPQGYDMRHLEWQPVKGEESIEEYAQTMMREIDATRPFMLAGLSFGGIVAVEISKYIKPERLILFSTVRTREDLPLLYRLAGTLKSHRLIPSAFFRITLLLLFWFFGPLDKEGRTLVASFLNQSDAAYLRWALGQISNWKNKHELESPLQIHGKLDRAFPVRLSKANYVINGAGHFCVFTHAQEVNEILRRELPENPVESVEPA